MATHQGVCGQLWLHMTSDKTLRHWNWLPLSGVGGVASQVCSAARGVCVRQAECCMGGLALLHGQSPTAPGGSRARPDGHGCLSCPMKKRLKKWTPSKGAQRAYEHS
jgi:hypothetical protein